MERESTSSKFPIGSNLPSFNLKNVDGNFVDSDKLDITGGLLVTFTCNHCPYVKGSEEMLIDLVRTYQSRGLSALAINSNDAQQYPEDNFEKMKAKSARMDLPYPYLFDESQDVAKLFDAACTPECYLFDKSRKLVYHGAISNSPRYAEEVRDVYLKSAIEQLLKGDKVDPAFVHPMGCSIKWKG